MEKPAFDGDDNIPLPNVTMIMMITMHQVAVK